MRTTETPPDATEEERKTYWFGKTATGQHARQHKTTKTPELWWTSDDGTWGTYYGAHPLKIIFTPRMPVK